MTHDTTADTADGAQAATNYEQVQELDHLRPPEEAMVATGDRRTDDGWEHVEFDELVPESELPEDVDKCSHRRPLEDYNEEEDFVVVHHRAVYDGDDSKLAILLGESQLIAEESGIIRVLAPEYEVDEDGFLVGDAFDTWQAAEAFIAEHFEQPDDEHEVIRPFPEGHLEVAVWHHVVDGKALDTDFHENEPGDGSFFDDAVSIDE